MTRNAKAGRIRPVCDARKSSRPSPRTSGGLSLIATAMMIGMTHQDPVRDVGARAAQRRLDQLGAQHRRGEHQNASTSPRNASSRRRRDGDGLDRRRRPAPARATRSERADRRRSTTASPGGSSSTRVTVGQRARAPARGRATSSTSRYTEPGCADELGRPSPTRPACPCPSRPRGVQICSTSARMWLEKSTVAPASATRCTSWRTSRISPGSSPLVGSSSTSTSGRPSSTRARPSRCRMPCE